jgi:hypothetical protein
MIHRACDEAYWTRLRDIIEQRESMKRTASPTG